MLYKLSYKIIGKQNANHIFIIYLLYNSIDFYAETDVR